jgi:hypothetical protein
LGRGLVWAGIGLPCFLSYNVKLATSSTLLAFPLRCLVG